MLAEKEMNADLIQEAIAYVDTLFKGNADGHGKDHAMRVYRNAMTIAETEPCDKQMVAIAAILHDADDHKIFDTKDNANTRTFLMQHNIEQNIMEQIISIINAVSFSKNGDKKPETIEGMIVQDADRLDAMGAVGIARAFAYGGKHGRDFDSSIQHFYDKLLRLKDLMNTQTARNMAEERHDFLIQFLKEWDKETKEPNRDGEFQVPNIDLNKAIEVLKKRQKDVGKYFEIMKEINPEDANFRRKFDAFYRVRRSEKWRTDYFELMRVYQQKNSVTFGEILLRIYLATGQVEASFASKMLATLDADMPIWDSRVLTVLNLKLSGKDGNIRMSNAVVLYDRICQWYQRFLKTENARKMICRFDEELPEFQLMSKTKKIDFILWASE